MNHTWGRTETAGSWLHPTPAWTIAALLLGLLSALAIGAYQYEEVWTPLERLYLPTYVRSQLMGALGFTTDGPYHLLEAVERQGSRLALDDEVRPETTEAGEQTVVLTAAAAHGGDRRLLWTVGRYSHAQLHVFLRRWVYQGQTVWNLMTPALWGAVGVFAASLIIAIPRDLVRSRERRHGRRLRGPELVTPARFNRRTRGGGIGFVQARRPLRRASWVRLPRAIESSHFLIVGDSGTGKSTLIRQVLQQVDASGETAIVYDPALEYTAQFYTPDRGDVILNPLDARSPYWSPADEVRQDAEALTLAKSLFPDRHHDNQFFTEGPRRIFAHLLTLKLTPEELTWCLCHEDELDRRVQGTPYAPMIDRQAPAQRSGVLASLNMVADALQLLPVERHTTRRWSAATWAREHQGWLFLTSTPETRERLVPLTSLWLDLLVLRLMDRERRHMAPTWFVLDELASLQRLPQLHTAITENRKSGNPVVLGFQGRSQLETRYGHDAEAMLSQPATKIFLRTSEPHAAKWIADTIGDIEVERLRESRSNGRGAQQTYGLERQVEPLVMASEITGLAGLRAYLKLGNLVVRMSFPFVELPTRAPAFVERPHSPRQPSQPPAGMSPIGRSAPEPSARLATDPGDSQRLGAGHEGDHLFG